MIKKIILIATLISFEKNFCNAMPIKIDSNFCVNAYCQKELAGEYALNPEAQKEDLKLMINNMDTAMDPYMKLARMFKVFLVPVIQKWSQARNLSNTPLLEWAKSPLTQGREIMYKNITSFAKLKSLLTDITLFMTDIAFQSDKIYKECKDALPGLHPYAAQEILNYRKTSFSIPGTSVMEKMQLISTERTLAILEITGSLLEGN